MEMIEMATIVFSPHPDDETLACGGTIAKKIKNGEKVYIVFMTDGRNSHKAILGIEDKPNPEEVKAIRKNESKEATKILGVKENDVFFLDFEDRSLQDNMSKAKELVKSYLIKLKPSEIFIPQKYDGHKDHPQTNTIVLSASKELHLNVNVYEYIIGSKAQHNNEKFSTRYIIKKLQVFKSAHTTKVDISDFVDLKSKAISAYKSQISMLFSSQTKSVLNESFLLSFKGPVEYFVNYRLMGGRLLLNEIKRSIESHISSNNKTHAG